MQIEQVHAKLAATLRKMMNIIDNNGRPLLLGSEFVMRTGNAGSKNSNNASFMYMIFQYQVIAQANIGCYAPLYIINTKELAQDGQTYVYKPVTNPRYFNITVPGQGGTQESFWTETRKYPGNQQGVPKSQGSLYNLVGGDHGFVIDNSNQAAQGNQNNQNNQNQANVNSRKIFGLVVGSANAPYGMYALQHAASGQNSPDANIFIKGDQLQNVIFLVTNFLRANPAPVVVNNNQQQLIYPMPMPQNVAPPAPAVVAPPQHNVVSRLVPMQSSNQNNNNASGVKATLRPTSGPFGINMMGQSVVQPSSQQPTQNVPQSRPIGSQGNNWKKIAEECEKKGTTLDQLKSFLQSRGIVGQGLIQAVNVIQRERESIRQRNQQGNVLQLLNPVPSQPFQQPQPQQSVFFQPSNVLPSPQQPAFPQHYPGTPSLFISDQESPVPNTPVSLSSTQGGPSFWEQGTPGINYQDGVNYLLSSGNDNYDPGSEQAISNNNRTSEEQEFKKQRKDESTGGQKRKFEPPNSGNNDNNQPPPSSPGASGGMVANNANLFRMR